MKVEFSGEYDDSWANVRTLSDVLRINDWSILDSFNIDYDELNGDKRIIITRIKDESKQLRTDIS